MPLPLAMELVRVYVMGHALADVQAVPERLLLLTWVQEEPFLESLVAPFQVLKHLVLVAAHLALLLAEDVQAAKDVGQVVRANVKVTVVTPVEQNVWVDVVVDVREFVADVWLVSMVLAKLVTMAVMDPVVKYVLLDAPADVMTLVVIVVVELAEENVLLDAPVDVVMAARALVKVVLDVMLVVGMHAMVAVIMTVLAVEVIVLKLVKALAVKNV